MIGACLKRISPFIHRNAATIIEFHHSACGILDRNRRSINAVQYHTQSISIRHDDGQKSDLDDGLFLIDGCT